MLDALKVEIARLREVAAPLEPDPDERRELGSKALDHALAYLDQVETAPSNLAFDEQLKARDPKWGLRSVEDFDAAARERGFEMVETRTMPANNLMLLFRRG